MHRGAKHESEKIDRNSAIGDKPRDALVQLLIYQFQLVILQKKIELSHGVSDQHLHCKQPQAKINDNTYGTIYCRDRYSNSQSYTKNYENQLIFHRVGKVGKRNGRIFLRHVYKCIRARIVGIALLNKCYRFITV